MALCGTFSLALDLLGLNTPTISHWCCIDIVLYVGVVCFVSFWFGAVSFSLGMFVCNSVSKGFIVLCVWFLLGWVYICDV